MPLRPLLLALLLAALPAAAAARPCKGRLSGSVQGSFACVAGAVTRGDTHYFVIEGKGPIEGIPSYAPGGFELPELKPGTYTMDTLGSGRASVAAEGGTLYIASKTFSVRGEVTLTLKTARRSKKEKDRWEVSGTYRARLLPAGGGKTGEVLVDVTF